MNKTKNEIFIVAGGNLDKQLISYIDIDNKLLIGVDRGIEWLFSQNIVPDYFVGDFDSIDVGLLKILKKNYNNKIIKFPAVKDETDTELALRFAIIKRPEIITIIGGTGSRIDHVLANIHILIQAEEENIKTILYDTNNRTQLLFPEKILKIKKSQFKYVSLLALTDIVDGICVNGFKYPLSNATMKLGYPYGVSNELLAEEGNISIKRGILLVVESKD